MYTEDQKRALVTVIKWHIDKDEKLENVLSRYEKEGASKEKLEFVRSQWPIEAQKKAVKDQAIAQPAKPSIQKPLASEEERKYQVLAYIESKAQAKESFVFETVLKKALTRSHNLGSPFTDEEVALHTKYYWDIRKTAMLRAAARRAKKEGLL